ncbi:flagellar filament capping protein FliD [Paractinoplanes toevensis]|uniref:flagellar filament capping protein FliD n=1 Tax=Paractinoplanes toevensis TaxID=571911 RepID=UPI001BB33279|nr:flagellar filament capping protein FliD [Actinoplanes toevensis]
MSTSTVIAQLMQVEQAPQNRLKAKVTTAQTASASYTSVNAKVAAFKSAAGALNQLGTWRAIAATSSSSSVAVSTSTNLSATTGSLTFDVTSLASKQATTMKVTTYVDGDGDGKLDTKPAPISSAPDTISITTTAGKQYDIDITADKSAAGIAKAINDSDAGVSAYVMKTSDSEGVLQITGRKSGASNGFTITGLDGLGANGTSPETTAAKSATIEVEGGGSSTYTVTSDTNTFTGLMNGVTLTVSKQENDVTIDVTNDTGAIADKMQAFVDAANAALTEISTQTAYDPATKTGSPLTGDFSVRDIASKILGSISTGLNWSEEAAGGADITDKIKSLKNLGIELQQDGQLKFTRSEFLNAYATNPDRVKEAGQKLGTQIEKMTTTMTTNLKSVILGRNNEIDSLNTQISNWDVRLAAKKLALQKQYSNLEVSLGNLKNQSTWLAGQLAGLG